VLIPEAFLYGLLWGWFCRIVGFLVTQPFPEISRRVGEHGKEKWIPRNAKGSIVAAHYAGERNALCSLDLFYFLSSLSPFLEYN